MKLADAIAEMDRSHVLSQTSFNRSVAARQQLEALEAAYEENKEVPLDLVLDAQRRVAEAESRSYRALAEYAIATKNVHFVKGTLLEFDGVYLAEGPWSCEAHLDAADREALRGEARPLNYASSRAPVVSWGEYPQDGAGGAASAEYAHDPESGDMYPMQYPMGEALPAPRRVEPTPPIDPASEPEAIVLPDPSS